MVTYSKATSRLVHPVYLSSVLQIIMHKPGVFAGVIGNMCIAVPAEVLELKDGNIAVVDYGNLQQEVRMELVDAKVGEFVLVHVGFAIQKLSREEGLETRELFKQVYAAMEESE